MKDDLGDRIKSQYEDRTRYMLPRRTYTLLRLDGKSFHTYTRGLNKPFDHDLFADIDEAIKAMLPDIQGSVFAYTQSDEISVLLTDFAQPTTSAWFDGNLQKIASVAASIITAEFNRFRLVRACGIESGDKYRHVKLAHFDARVFTIPDRIEVMNYFIWRNQDCARNSVSMLAQSLFSHKQLQGVSTSEMVKMIAAHEGGAFAWDSLNQDLRFGRLIVKETFQDTVSVPDVKNFKVVPQLVERTRWVSTPAWKFTENKDKLLDMIPKYAAD